MGGIIPDATIQSVRAASDIVSVVQSYLPEPLKQKGRSHWARCPFHKEKSASFSVNPEREIFKCFGCGEGGDVFGFVQKFEGVSFPEAVRILARRAGIEIAENDGPPESGPVKSPLYDANAWAAGVFHKCLTASMAGKPALKYLHSRQVGNEAVERYQLGYAPAGWDNLLKAARRDSVPESALSAAGLIVARDEGGHYDRFRDRIMFPILDPQSRVVGFGGRVLGEGEPKYLNSPESSIYQKGRLLYLAERAKLSVRETRKAIVVEGYMDAIMCHEFDVPNTVAVLGTALTTDHVRYLRRFADEVIVVFDGDAAGVLSADRSLAPLIENELECRVAVLPDGLDPSDFLVERGREAFLKVLGDAPDGLGFRLAAARESASGGGSLGRSRAVDQALELIALMPNPVARSLAVDRLAGEARLAVGSVRERLDRIMSRKRRPSAGQDAPPPPRRDVEEELIQVMLNYPQTIENVGRRVDLQWFQSPPAHLVAETILVLREQGKPADAAAVLRRLTDEEARDLVGRLMERKPERVDPQAWCAELLKRIEGRAVASETEEIRQRVAEAGQATQDEEELLRRFLEGKRRTHEKPAAAAKPPEPPPQPREETGF